MDSHPNRTVGGNGWSEDQPSTRFEKSDSITGFRKQSDSVANHHLGAVLVQHANLLRRDSTHFTVSHMRSRVIKLDEASDYQILSPQSTSALETHLGVDGTFRGSLRIRDPEAFWKGSKWLVILQR